MNAVAFYSNTGQSRAVARFFSRQLGYPLVSVEESREANYQNLVLVFPVHCQGIPEAVRSFLEKIAVENLTVVATYGRMCRGNVLYEIQRKYQGNVVAGAYVPTKHSYIENDEVFCDFDKLKPVVEKIKEPSYIRLPRLFKNPLADFFPRQRGIIGLKIQRSEACDGCGLCEESCSLGAIRRGETNNRCIRCLKCVDVCPRQALTVKLGLPLRLYLRKKKLNKVIIYV